MTVKPLDLEYPYSESADPGRLIDLYAKVNELVEVVNTLEVRLNQGEFIESASLHDTCPTCVGIGFHSVSSMDVCDSCQGLGSVPA